MEPEIPELKKKEKEKKGGAVPWLRGSGASPVAGAAGHAGSGLSGGWSLFGSSSWLGALLSSKVGVVLVLSCGVLSAGAGLALYKDHVRNASKAVQRPSLDGAGDARPVVRKPSDRYLNDLSRMNKGEILFDTAPPVAPKEDPAQTQGGEPDSGPPPPPDPEALARSAQGGLDATRDQFIRKLTSDPQSLSGGAFGGMGGVGSRPSSMANSLKSALGGIIPKLHGSRLSTFKRKPSSLKTKSMSVKRVTANRAMGQLKFARGMSVSGLTSSADDSSRRYAADAFDQGLTKGGEASSPIGISPGETVVPPTPDITQPGFSDLPTPPDVGIPMNITPYQSLLDMAGFLGSLAGMLKMMGTMLMIAGLLLIAAGVALMSSTGLLAFVGAALIAAGAALLMMGIGMMNQAQSLLQQGQQMAQQISDQYGQKEQSDIAKECVDQAYNDGTKPSDCKPTTKVEMKDNDVHSHVEDERNSVPQTQ